MMYFDQAATSLQKPYAVYKAVNNAMRTCAGMGRSGHDAAIRASEIAFACRKEAAELFDAEPEQVVFTFNATHALNMAIGSLVGEGDSVVISGFEHNAVVRPLWQIGAAIHVAGRRLFDPEDTVSAFRNAVNSKTKAVICTHVSNVFGYVLPVEQIARICYERNVPLIIDASQSAGVLPVSLHDLHAVFIAMPGHKGLYGPQGTGILLCNQTPKPLLSGGTGSRSEDFSMPDFLPDVGEAGTHNLPGIAGLLEGIRYIRRRGTDNIRRREQALLSMLQEYSRFYAGNDLQTGVLSVQIPNSDCETAAWKLSQAGFAVRAGLHCAPLAHESAGTLQTGTLRISISDFNTKEEVLALAKEFDSLK